MNRKPPWRATRANHLRTYPECYACFTDIDLVVHHLRYRGPRGQSEQSGDLVTLCASCHDELHRVVGHNLGEVRVGQLEIRSRLLDNRCPQAEVDEPLRPVARHEVLSAGL